MEIEEKKKRGPKKGSRQIRTTQRKSFDLTGKRFGKLLVLEYYGYTNREKRHDGEYKQMSTWKCECDCGKVVVVKNTYLTNGETKSCGCLRGKVKGKRLYPLGKLYGDTASFNHLLSRYTSNAKAKGYDFKLTNEEFREVTSQKCTYCGIEPLQQAKRNGRSEYVNPYFFNGIDRVDNSIGYVKENCVPCCEICNKAKRDMDVTRFKDWIKRVHKFIQSQE